jgi:hypothetical protein
MPDHHHLKMPANIAVTIVVCTLVMLTLWGGLLHWRNRRDEKQTAKERSDLEARRPRWSTSIPESERRANYFCPCCLFRNAHGVGCPFAVAAEVREEQDVVDGKRGRKSVASSLSGVTVNVNGEGMELPQRVAVRG